MNEDSKHREERELRETLNEMFSDEAHRQASDAYVNMMLYGNEEGYQRPDTSAKGSEQLDPKFSMNELRTIRKHMRLSGTGYTKPTGNPTKKKQARKRAKQSRKTNRRK